jgi:hypothetical protein
MFPKWEYLRGRFQIAYFLGSNLGICYYVDIIKFFEIVSGALWTSISLKLNWVIG